MTRGQDVRGESHHLGIKGVSERLGNRLGRCRGLKGIGIRKEVPLLGLSGRDEIRSRYFWECLCYLSCHIKHGRPLGKSNACWRNTVGTSSQPPRDGWEPDRASKAICASRNIATRA